MREPIPSSADAIERRAARHGALSDTVRLAIVDELSQSDRAPLELRRLVGIQSNLLAHHLDVLENVGLINRTRSSGDGRRRYVHLLRDTLPTLVGGRRITPGHALFVCTHNSARSQLAAAIWRSMLATPADSAGTHPAERVHPGAVAAAKRAGLDLRGTVPRHLASVSPLPPIIVTVCDQAHEELEPGDHWLHWSVPDPVILATPAAFDATIDELRTRIAAIATSPEPTP